MLAIVAIVMTSVIAFAARPSDSLMLRQTAAQAKVLFQAARARALTTNMETRIDYDREAGTLTNTGLGKAIDLPVDMKVSLTTARQELRGETIASIRFLPDGRSTGGDLTLTRGRQAMRISIDWLTGAVSSEEVPPQ